MQDLLFIDAYSVQLSIYIKEARICQLHIEKAFYSRLICYLNHKNNYFTGAHRLVWLSSLPQT